MAINYDNQANEAVDLGTGYSGSSSGKIVSVSGNKRSLAPHQVVIDITHSGICGTDLHFRKQNMVLGHEGVGLISKIGSQVNNVKVGDRVGWGYIHDVDGTCSNCLQGRDNLCETRKVFGQMDKDQASLGERFVIRSDFVHVIPDSLPLRYAAPLQCAGATVWGAIEAADIRSFDRVGVVGIGGLGHLAIQYLKSMGCDVCVFSTTESKREEAMKLGASEFVATKANAKLEGVKPVNHLLVSADRQVDWATYFKVMAPNGQVVPLSVSNEDMKGVPYMPILTQQFKILGSFVADRATHRRMLEFSARHQIRPIIEELKMTEENVNVACDRLEKGDVRYRFVMSTGVPDPLYPESPASSSL